MRQLHYHHFAPEMCFLLFLEPSRGSRTQGWAGFCSLVAIFHDLVHPTFANLWQSCHIQVLLSTSFLVFQKLFQSHYTRHFTNLLIVYSSHYVAAHPWKIFSARVYPHPCCFQWSSVSNFLYVSVGQLLAKWTPCGKVSNLSLSDIEFSFDKVCFRTS